MPFIDAWLIEMHIAIEVHTLYYSCKFSNRQKP